MKKSEILILIDLFKAKAKDKSHLYEQKGKIADTDTYMYKLFNSNNEAVACIAYNNFPYEIDLLVEIYIGYGHYTCDNFEIAKLLIDFIKY